MTDSGSRVLQGIALMAAAMLVIPVIDAIAKALGGRVPVVQIAWARFAFQSLFVGVAALWVLRGTLWRPVALGRQLARGALIALATVLFFEALQHLPMAETISIFFVEPLILTLFAALFLGEPIGWRRVAAVLIGFAGALLIVQPSFREVGSPALLPLGAALAFACYLVLTRQLGGRVSPLAMQFYAGLAGTLVLGVLMLVGYAAELPRFAPQVVAAADWAALALLGAVGASAHMLIVLAFARAPASTLAPFQYLEIITATLLGYLVFDELPGGVAVLGMVIIIGSGLYVAWRERVGERARQGGAKHG